jgi:glutamate-1-semialdehyde 2,1-aminomutase
MMAVSTPRTSIDEEYWKRFPTSAELFARARSAIPSGVTHDARSFSPFPVYMSRAEGAYKWDADGNRILDFWVGHGSLILGHNHPVVTQAISEALARGTHLGACHEDEVEWAELVHQLVPCADEVRFTMSGTESTMLALRDARSFSGKPKVLRFHGHFHGWHDYAMVGYQPPYDSPTSAGIPDAVLSTMVSVAPSIAAVKEALEADEQIGSVILEPSGASWGLVPLPTDFLAELRQITAQRGLVLIFDEVVTGFRWSPGGAQGYYGVTPDLSTMAKIVAGGLPGGAVAGRRDIMEQQSFTGQAEHDRFQRVLQQGTFNCNLPSTAAGIAALKIVAEGEVTEYCARLGQSLREGLNEALTRRGVPGIVHGERSTFHILLGEGMAEAVAACDTTRLLGARGAAGALRKAMLLEGVDLMRSSGLICAAHTDGDITSAVAAFDRALGRLQTEGVL